MEVQVILLTVCRPNSASLALVDLRLLSPDFKALVTHDYAGITKVSNSTTIAIISLNKEQVGPRAYSKETTMY